MTHETTPGLRERKRLATRRAIQFAAIELGEEGLDRVTIDEISRRADVSPRTFFNYFPTKEAALIGDGPSLPDAESIEQFLAGTGTILGDIATLLTESPDLDQDRELTLARRHLLKQHPQLFAMRMATMHGFEYELQAIVARRIVSDELPATLEPAEIGQRAKLVTLVAVAAMRHAWACWADTSNTDELVGRLRASFEQLESLLSSNASK